MQIIDLQPDDERAIEQSARLLVEGFSIPAWPDMKAALDEVRASFGEEHISRVALDEGGNVLGWIGGISEYNGHVWELHPLVVDVRYQGQGVGRSLVQDFEKQVQAADGV